MRDRINEMYSEYKYIWLVLVVFANIVMVLLLSVKIHKINTKNRMLTTEIVVSDIVPKVDTKYSVDKRYYKEFSTATETPVGDTVVFGTEEMEEELERYLAYVDERARFSNEQATFNHEYVVTDANRELFEIADKYYQVYWGSQRVSPIYPLAVANVETGNRADHSITWSALFPSKYVNINEMHTMDVTTVLSDESIYKALSTESSTRDRGALQMSPTYGTGNGYFNSLMSGREVDKLSGVDTHGHDNWVARASSEAGDRFYIPDVCLRLAAANTDAIERMAKNGYPASSDTQLIAMLAMYHHRSGVWSNGNHSKSIGEWKSGDKAFEYARLVGSDAMVAELSQYARENEDKFWIDADVARSVFKDVTGRSMSEFASKTLVCTYPIKVLYAYIKLSIMYGGM